MGQGVGNWTRIHEQSPFAHNTVTMMHWTYENGWKGDWPTTYNKECNPHLVICNYPHNRLGQKYLSECLQACIPDIIVFDSHPRLSGDEKVGLHLNMRNWSWLVDAAALGPPVNCIRRVTVAVSNSIYISPGMAPIYIYDVSLPISISDYLQGSEERDHILGELHVTHAEPPEGYEPTHLGWINVKRDKLSQGLKVRTAKSGDGVISGPGQQKDTWKAETKKGSQDMPAPHLLPLPTRYQVFSAKGVSFPFGTPYAPAALGHTLILDPNTARVRRLTHLECWCMLGGDPVEYTASPPRGCELAILGSAPPRHVPLLGPAGLWSGYPP